MNKRKTKAITGKNIREEIGNYYDKHKASIDNFYLGSKNSFINYAESQIHATYRTKTKFTAAMNDVVSQMQDPTGQKKLLKYAKKNAINRDTARAFYKDLRTLNLFMRARLVEVDKKIDDSLIPVQDFGILSDCHITGYYSINVPNKENMILARVEGNAFNPKTNEFDSNQTVWVYLDKSTLMELQNVE